MSTINVTNINDGDAVTAASINNQVNTIVNDYNGNITSANLASNAVTTAKITNANVTPDKLATGAATQTVVTSQTRTSSTAGDLATVGPNVTVTIGANGLALVSLGAAANNSTTDYCIIYLTISGANTVAATQWYVIQGTNQVQSSSTFLLTGLVAGSTTFKMQYSNFNNASTATFANRTLTVVPL